jgi:hypothetical protein
MDLKGKTPKNSRTSTGKCARNGGRGPPGVGDVDERRLPPQAFIAQMKAVIDARTPSRPSSVPRSR